MTEREDIKTVYELWIIIKIKADENWNLNTKLTVSSGDVHGFFYFHIGNSRYTYYILRVKNKIFEIAQV